jgi:hypothetical protein
MSRLNTFIRFPLAAAMLAAMGTLATGCRIEQSVHPEGEAVAIETLPDAARASIQANAGKEGVSRVTAFQEEGEQMYLARTIKDGRATDIEVFSSGQVACIQTQVRPEELPAPVKRVADAETLGYPQRVFWKKENRDKAAGFGVVVTYVVEAASTSRDKQVEIDPSGKVLRSAFSNN